MKFKVKLCVGERAPPAVWKAPPTGMVKLNFDSGQIGEQGWGSGFVVRGFDGAVVLAGV